uniref:NAC domain-containing protein n=1 Tax=Oryza punctata TaxID=4537 RepID=A0A0E0M5Y8_ORYPU
MTTESNAGDGSAAAPASNGDRRHKLEPHLRLDPGYHFVPSDEELVDFYLRGKIEGRRPPMDFINEVDIMSFDPVKLIEKYKGYGENRWYFFTVRKPSKTKKRDEPNRKVVVDGVEEGSWSATGSVVYICGKDQETIIGTKRVLTYKSVRSPEEDKWSMHEYIMVDKSQMDQYVLCAIQFKHTYEAEKKVQEEKKRGVKRKRTATRKGRKGDIDQTTSQEQEEDQQQETSPPGDPHDQSVDASYCSMQMMLGGEEEVAPSPWCDDCMTQPDQTEYPAVWYFQQEQQPLCFVDRLMMTQGYIGDISYIQNQFDQHQADDHGSIAFDEALDQRHDTNFTWDNAGIYPGNNLLDGNLDDYTQNQFGNQATLGPLVGGLEHGTGYQFHDTIQAMPGSDDACAQSMGIQPAAAGHSIGDDDDTWCNDDLSSLLDDISRSLLLDGNGVIENEGNPEGSNQGLQISAKMDTNGRS